METSAGLEPPLGSAANSDAESVAKDEVQQPPAPEPAIITSSWCVGDIVRLGDTVGKQFQQAEAQVTKVSPKTLQVILLEGKNKDKFKNFRPEQVTLIQPSAMRSLAQKGRVPVCPPEPPGGFAAAGAASASSAAAPAAAASASSAPPPVAPATAAPQFPPADQNPYVLEAARRQLEAEEAGRLAEALFAEDDDEVQEVP